MKTSIEKGDVVFWEWGKVIVSGKVIDMYAPLHAANLDLLALQVGMAQTAKALLIEMKDGRKVIKMEVEVNRVKN